MSADKPEKKYRVRHEGSIQFLLEDDGSGGFQLFDGKPVIHSVPGNDRIKLELISDCPNKSGGYKDKITIEDMIKNKNQEVAFRLKILNQDRDQLPVEYTLSLVDKSVKSNSLIYCLRFDFYFKSHLFFL